ncbi:SH2 domain-containing protein 4B-like isoform X2 [Physella acuta]|uniref:SH2 domain-containing protein 4B-like isoform X2 n=1 Tax=Physella acuta TaxID=109671 RepID=UPI0027DE7F17|nr:SH2 domain-containing protein 4B-like isoform X2 [Physella acuta]
MLQQILEQMYIDPELIEELSEDQKQILFYKMRQEQVKRWKQFEEKMEEEDKKKKSKPQGKKKVDFLKGRDGGDWVWVMGEHPNDKSIEEILEEEAKKTAQKLAEAEAQLLREKEEAELHRKLEEERLRVIKENEEREKELKRQQEEAALYQSQKEAKLAMEKMELEKKRLEEDEKKRLLELAPLVEHSDTGKHSSPILNSPFLSEQEKKARRKSREMTELIKEKRSSEIYLSLKEHREKMKKVAEESAKEVESTWQEQEKKSKEADIQKREVAANARTEYRESVRRSMNLMQAAQAFAQGGNKPPLPPKKHLLGPNVPISSSKKPKPLRPKNREMVVSWFKKEEAPKGTGLDPTTGKVANWFHGIINRTEAEKFLEGKPNGSYLVRVSERVWGYTLSLKETNRLKHFLIDASDLGYQFIGADQTVHDSLASLIQFHKDNPITISGKERLIHPCGQTSDPPDYWELFHNTTTEATAL